MNAIIVITYITNSCKLNVMKNHTKQNKCIVNIIIVNINVAEYITYFTENNIYWNFKHQTQYFIDYTVTEIGHLITTRTCTCVQYL